MSRTLRDVGWVTRKDGEPDQRYSMPQVLNVDGSKDKRFGSFETPSFGTSETLTHGRSQYYDQTSAPSGPGVYQLMTTNGIGRPKIRYTGMSNDIGRRLDEHARCTSDNITTQMNQAANRGMDVRARFAPADSALEARAQELFLLGQRDYAWNERNNGGATKSWWK
ncbi:unnamed protein product [Rotaria socialis]|uniref:GIY-YIG domain-containing protein n=1 Tax=Rotaria socialis TaxID=392032 RepID=A0A818HDP2_9BILA|nr:unnamed protein product [Rotaria socialis]CAF4775825.1 unnamed protein product [Rotaria socialis]